MQTGMYTGLCVPMNTQEKISISLLRSPLILLRPKHAVSQPPSMSHTISRQIPPWASSKSWQELQSWWGLKESRHLHCLD